jgi:hypothetical protein
MLPETTSAHVKTIASAELDDEAAEEAGPLLEEGAGTPSRYSNAFQAQPGAAQSVLQAVRKLLGLVVGRPNLQVLLISFFLTALASSDTKLLVQYISKRYGWTFAQAGYMLSAKAIVNFTLLAIFVPRMIKSSMSTKVVHGSEVRLNYLGAIISILVSVVGVLCVALAFEFWMLLAGKSNRATLKQIRADIHSTCCICFRISITRIHHVACQVATDSACELRCSGFQHCHVDQNAWFSCWRPAHDSALGSGYQDWWYRIGTAIFYLCSKLSSHGNDQS